MELKDLKNAWNKFSSDDANKHRLGEKAILEMLRNRTTDMIERIDRNIKIGFGVLILLILFFILDDFVFTPRLASASEFVPAWVPIMGGVGILFISGTFVYFWLNYRSTKRMYSLDKNLRNVLQSIIHILNFYQRLFYIALALLLLVLSVSFVSGMFAGIELKAREIGSSVVDLGSSPEMIREIILGSILLVVSIGGLFLLFRWGFRRLYGNYIFKLKETLQELDEIE